MRQCLPRQAQRAMRRPETTPNESYAPRECNPTLAIAQRGGQRKFSPTPSARTRCAREGLLRANSLSYFSALHSESALLISVGILKSPCMLAMESAAVFASQPAAVT